MSAKSAASDTKEQLLDAAEELIAESGYGATTVRGIVQRAGVNIAAVSYHFGSKEELFRAVVERIARPVVDQQLQMLAELEHRSQAASVSEILTAFFTPPLQLIMQQERCRIVRAQFMGRCRVEPGPIQAIAAGEFAASVTAFLDVLQQALPHQSREELAWKLDLLIAVLVRVQTEAGQPSCVLKGNDSADIERAIDHLVGFMTPGMQTTIEG